MSPEIFKNDWIDRAFGMAFFLHGDRETAKKIALRAMTKLETASNAQFKRFYYTPTGRQDSARATRNRVSMNDLQLLQRLVFVESEEFERAKEKTLGERPLLKFYIKHLVRIALKRNSFYVTLGVARILHNYATADAMEIYNIVVQDPERVHDDYYYRSRKGVLMKELKARFGSLLETVRVNRGEERFGSRPEAEDLLATARDCLKNFTPWNSYCAIPDEFDPTEDLIAPFYFDKKDPDEEHRIEINRIHAALHPGCFARLTDALDLPPSPEKMEIPHFMIEENYTETDGDPPDPPHLDPDELEQIREILKAQAESRKAMAANVLRVVVDGDEKARIDLAETGRVDFDLDDSAELIEVRVVEKDEDLIVATHLLSFDELQKGAHFGGVRLEGGQEISFDLKPSLDQYGEVSSINCAVEFSEKEKLAPVVAAPAKERFSLSVWLDNLGWAFKPALGFGLILLMLGFGWLVYRGLSGEEKKAQNEEFPAVDREREVNIPAPPVEPKKEVAPPEEEHPSGNGSLNAPQNPNHKAPGRNSQSKPRPERQRTPRRSEPKNKVVLGPPPRELQAVSDSDGILRLPIYGEKELVKNDPRAVPRNKLTGRPLSEIKRVFIEISGDEVLGRQIAEKISVEAGRSGRFVFTPDKESADAALKIYVRHESDVDDPDEKMVTAVIRLVNDKGYVVYPVRRGVIGWKYVGPISKLPGRIARELSSGSKQ
ncbi:MAG: hypothetical protein R2747_20900 [Pyrinomonadaceae bacterium]